MAVGKPALHCAISSLYIGFGWIGGLIRMAAFVMVAATGSLFAGVWRSIDFGEISLVCCPLLLPETLGQALIHEPLLAGVAVAGPGCRSGKRTAAEKPFGRRFSRTSRPP